MLQNLPDLTMYQILHILWPFISQEMINKRLYQSDESTTSRSDVQIKFPDDDTEYEDDKEYSDVPTKYIRNDYTRSVKKRIIFWAKLNPTFQKNCNIFYGQIQPWLETSNLEQCHKGSWTS